MQLPTVFISYTHDSEKHQEAVLRFAELLAEYRIYSVNDLWADPDRRYWGEWAEKCIDESDYTLVIASPGYRRVGNGEATDDENRGGVWEVAHLRERLQQARSVWTRRILPVMLPGRTVSEIPTFLQPYGCTHYPVPTLDANGIQTLYRDLTRQPEYTRPELGEPMILPPKSGPGSPGWESRRRRA
ncbi:SEFIR domain-containing protein [Saccharopolyspora shandongensis]|uniref:SEFIR domain-containing protein n=1 Tax=Saccharopolyspora shandongensis TaxID=418495 RepID=UPI0033CB541E